MGAEWIVIAGTRIQTIQDETTSSNPLEIAATNDERTLIVKFPADAFTGSLVSGMAVEARGLQWQIDAGLDSIRKGQIATTLTLVEPERRKRDY